MTPIPCSILKKDPVTNDCDAMLDNFDIAIGRGQKNSNNRGKPARIDRYLLLSERPEYNDRTIPDFNFNDWQTSAIDINSQIDADGEQETSILWKSPRSYKQTNWYKFQEAIKEYQKRTLEIYQNSVYKQLSPELLGEILRFR